MYQQIKVIDFVRAQNMKEFLKYCSVQDSKL